MDLKLPKPKNPMGYTPTELNAMMTVAERKRFNKVAGVNTCAIDPVTGETLMYPWDVQKYLGIVRGARGPERMEEWD